MSNRYKIIIPCYNEDKVISLTLTSLINQTIKPSQVIVVDDGSTDDSVKKIEEYSKKYSFIKLVKKESSKEGRLPGSKVIEAFYYGMDFIDGEYDYISKLDADIILPTNYYERLLKFFSGDNAIGMAGGVLQIENNMGSWEDEGKVNSNHLRGAIKTYSKTCFEKIGGIKKSIGWDTIDVILAKHYGFKVFIDKSLKVKLLYPTGKRYQSEHAKKIGIGMYKMRYTFFIAFISCMKAGWVRKNFQFFFNSFYKGFIRSLFNKETFSVTEEEGQIIR
ncbi:MAG: glycosyltransferase, partial [Flavobacteriales bacterium]